MYFSTWRPDVVSFVRSCRWKSGANCKMWKWSDPLPRSSERVSVAKVKSVIKSIYNHGWRGHDTHRTHVDGKPDFYVFWRRQWHLPLRQKRCMFGPLTTSRFRDDMGHQPQSLPLFCRPYLQVSDSAYLRKYSINMLTAVHTYTLTLYVGTNRLLT